MAKIKISFITWLLISLASVSYSQSGWFFQNSNSHNPIMDVSFVNSKTGFASGWWGLITKTTDGGNTWNPQIIDSTDYFNDIFFINSMTGFVGCQHNRIFKTTNSGNTWNAIEIDSIIFVESMFFINQNTGFVGSNNGFIAKSTNCGINWTVQRIAGEYIGLSSIEFAGVDTGYVYAGIGSLFKTTNSGVKWDTVYMYNSNALIGSIDFINNSTGYGIGGRRIYKTVNGGINWTIQFDIPTITLTDLCFCDLLTGFVVGYIFDPRSCVILRTMDGGENWSFNYSTTGFCLYSVTFVGKDTGYVVGGEGTNSYLNSIIMKTTTGGNPIGIKPISNETPKSFSLSQNYPNPFNPVTKVKFQIAKLCYAKLVIYDVMGRGVETLINQQLSPGTYEVEWDVSNYPSGVYFYRLTAGDFSETKKMVLIK